MNKLIDSLRKLESSEKELLGESVYGRDSKKRVSVVEKMNQEDASLLHQKSQRLAGSLPRNSDLFDAKKKIDGVKRDLDSIMWVGYSDELKSAIRSVEDLVSEYVIVQAALARQSSGMGD